jgi:formimidoylglutamate deiminase
VIEQEIRCSSMLSSDGWMGPSLIRLDAEGFISTIDTLPENATVDFGHMVPGMPNLHSHAFQRQMAGLSGLPGPAGDSFWSWRELMYRLAQRITPDQLLAIATFLQVEMLEHGYTSCAEFHYLHHQPGGHAYDDPAEMSAQIIAAAEQSGIALTLLPVLYCRSGFTSGDVTERQLRFRCTTDQYLDLWNRCRALTQGHNLHRCGLAPHSLRAVAAEQLNEVLAACQSVDQPIHIHIAEQIREVEECVEVLGARPVQHLLEQFSVDQHWCLVHATHINKAESAGCLKSGAVIGLCPSTEADLGDGYFSIENWFRQAGNFGIGSDSNLRLDPAEELRLLEFQARLQSGNRNVLTENGQSVGRSLYHRALCGGAQALGQKVGRIEPGYRADLVELDKEHLLLAGRSEDVLLDSWILAGDSSMIRSVWVGGRQQVAEGQHIAREKLQPAFRKAMQELL